jgi:hypothetical protein
LNLLFRQLVRRGSPVKLAEFIQQRIRHVYRRQRPTPLPSRTAKRRHQPKLAAAEHYGVDPLELLRIAYLPDREPKPKNGRKRQPPRQGSNVPPL